MNDDELHLMYVKRRWSLRHIAAHAGISVRQARFQLERADIPIRQRGPVRDTPRDELDALDLQRLSAQVATFGVREAALQKGISTERLHAELDD